MKLYTSMYSYKGYDRLDITVKGNDPVGKVFAPTWGILNKYRKDKDKISYMESYHTLMINSYRTNRSIWEEVLQRDRVTIVCFCRPGFCHRFILKDYLKKLGAEYMGEL